MRNMSFALTTWQMCHRVKTVTRRLGWWDLKAGELLCAVEKSQGLKKGEKIARIGPIRVTNARNERLRDITQEDVILEGFPEMGPAEFITMFCQHNNCAPNEPVRRIQFEFV